MVFMIFPNVTGTIGLKYAEDATVSCVEFDLFDGDSESDSLVTVGIISDI